MEYIVAALIASVPASVSAVAAWRSSKKVHASLGDSNGRGQGMRILERLDDRTDRLDARMTNMEERLSRVERNTLPQLPK